ncbi:MAG: YbjN domain-containing protein [Holosporaceae bacterium]|nr:YbjN domain-containing protein [Holosporaceae bacterium]
MSKISVNFIDIVEVLVTRLGLSFSRVDENEMSVTLVGDNAEYCMSVVFMPDYDMMRFSCDMNLVVPPEQYRSIVDAFAKANERVLVGCFGFVSNSRRIVYTITIPFMSSFVIDEAVVEAIIEVAVCESDKLYYYFYMAIENIELPDFPIGALFLESAGEA